MKIQFITNYSELYGANRSLLTLLNYFNSKEDYDIRLLLPSKGALINELKKKHISYRVISFFPCFLYVKPALKYLSLPFLICLNLIMFPIIFYNVKKFSPDVIYSNTSAENMGIIIARLLGKKHISHIREFMSLDHNAFFIGGREAKRKYIKHSDGVIFVSKSVANHVLIDENLKNNHAIIYNGVQIPLKDYSKKQIAREINFGIVGIFDPGKGQYQAIEYFRDIQSKYPTAKLHLYGNKEGHYKKQLLSLVKKLNLQQVVIFHGFESNINIIYSQLDVLLMFSRSEGFGRVTVEAMQREVPVVGYDKGGTSELIESGVSGYLFTDKESFINAIDTLFSDNNYQLIQQKAFAQAKDRFNEDCYCLNVENFLNEVIK